MSTSDPVPGGATPDDTTQTPPTSQVPVAADPGTASPELATERGTTTIAPGVIAAVARKAATEVPGVAGVEATGLRGVVASLRSASAGGATADVAARRASIDLRVAVQWPEVIHEVTARTRDHVRARVAELTGHAVTDVDIAVVSLPAPPSRPRRRVL
jgi:uncharacterized alkaline shock family protein YloU